MSERRAVWLIAMVATALASPASAQSPGSESDSLLRRVRVLDSVMVVRSRSVDSVRKSLVRPLPPVDIYRGRLRIRTDSALAPRVQLAMDSVSALIERRGGTVLAARVASHIMMVVPDSARSVFGIRRTIAVVADTTRRWSVGRAQAPANASAEQLAAALATMAEQVVLQGADSGLTAWIMSGRVPLRNSTPGEAGNAYVELATSESAVARRCRARDTASCLDALGVDSLPGTRLERWYSPEDYRALLRSVAPPREDSAAVAAWIHCREDRHDAACRIAAAALPNDRVPSPLSATVRQSFLRQVLDAGGPGAYDRLLTGSGPLRCRLGTAAGEPLDSTVVRWLARVDRSRPDRMRPPASLIVASLGWSAAFLALALIRRTSWA